MSLLDTDTQAPMRAPATLQGVNPATGTALDAVFQESSAADVDRALRAAQSAFAVYSRVPAAERARFLRVIVHELNALGDELL